MGISGITTVIGVTRGTGVTLWAGVTENGGVTDVGIGAPPSPPSNGYVAEDGTTYYVAEDGSTYYVQETVPGFVGQPMGMLLMLTYAS